jgi:uncharacterized protein
MKITVHKDARIRKGVTIIEGFPGFGLVGTIATEFLIDHLRTQIVGEFSYSELPATTAIHDGKLVRPMALHYDDKHNILIFHTILTVRSHEWSTAEEVVRIAKEYDAKEIISLEGVNALVPGEESRVFSWGNDRFVALGAEEMKESVIMGVTAALLLMAEKTSCLFAETHSALPDSKAAAAIISILDKYLGLGVNPEPLLRQAQEFEQKLKTILQQTQKTAAEAEKKNLSYLG